MADFTLNMTGSAQVDNSDVTEEIKTEMIFAYTQANIMDQFVEYDRDIDAKSISFPRFAALSVDTTPLNEREDVTSEALVDSEVIFTPIEYGKAVTPTRLSVLQTGGRTLAASIRQVGENMGRTTNLLATRALEATTNVSIVGQATEGAVTAGDIMSAAELNKIYNKMARANVPVHPLTGTYVAFMHDDVIHDLRAGSAAGSWEDINKYNNEIPVLRNEVGMYKGFRIVRNNDCLLNADGGSTTVDTYHSSFLGFNGLGKAESQMPAITFTGPFDKLGRFVNVGWYGVFQYGLVEEAAVWKSISASSVGANA